MKREGREVEGEVMRSWLSRSIVHQEGRRVGGTVVAGETKADIGRWIRWLMEVWLGVRRGRVVGEVVDDDYELMPGGY